MNSVPIMASAATLENLPVNRTDPLDRLPYDLWVKCICFATYNMADGPLPLLAVSRRWQANLLETPQVWTYIEISNSEDEELRIHTFLYLSGQCLFDVRIILPVINLKILSFIKEASTRVRAIIFGRPMESFLASNLQIAMEHLFPKAIPNIVYPELEEFNYDWSNNSLYRPYPTLMDQCPKLRIVPMFGLEHWNADIVLKQKLESFILWLELGVEIPTRVTTPEGQKAWISLLRAPTKKLA